MILEGLVTTLSADGELNVAPMGPVVDRDVTTIRLRPFQSSQTFRNLQQQPCGVLHVTDDVELLARAALHGLHTAPETLPARQIPGRVLANCCRWFEFRVLEIDASHDRAEVTTSIVHRGSHRDHFGFNRAMSAVLEATILATRLHLLDEATVRQELARLQSPVEKTAGNTETAAWAFVTAYVDRWYAERSA